MAKKKSKIKKRRKLSAEFLFNKRNKMREIFINQQLVSAFGFDTKRRDEYIDALIEGLENAPIKEL